MTLPELPDLGEGNRVEPPDHGIGEFVLYDNDGTPITGPLEILQRAVWLYEERRFTSVEGDALPWPELTDFSQLIKFEVVPSLPAPPPGQQFILDAKTKQVSLRTR